MKKYKVIIKHTDRGELINAKTELEAKVKFCRQNNLSYTHLANKLEIEKLER